MAIKTRYCDHIREDAYECGQKAKWIISPADDPYSFVYSCNNHLSKLIPREDTAYVGFLRTNK